MENTYTIKQAQANLPALVRAAEAGTCPVITRHEKTVAYVLSADRMQALVETLEIISNPQAMKAIESHRRGKGKLFGLEDLKG